MCIQTYGGVKVSSGGEIYLENTIYVLEIVRRERKCAKGLQKPVTRKDIRTEQNIPRET